jgi:hypothetical protein
MENKTEIKVDLTSFMTSYVCLSKLKKGCYDITWQNFEFKEAESGAQYLAATFTTLDEDNTPRTLTENFFARFDTTSIPPKLVTSGLKILLDQIQIQYNDGKAAPALALLEMAKGKTMKAYLGQDPEYPNQWDLYDKTEKNKETAEKETKTTATAATTTTVKKVLSPI